MSPVHQAPARPCGPSCLCGSDPGSSQHCMEVEAPKAVAWAQGSPREGGAASFRSSLRSLGTLLRGLGEVTAGTAGWHGVSFSGRVGCAVCTRPLCGGRISGVEWPWRWDPVRLEPKKTWTIAPGSSPRQVGHKLQCPQPPPVYRTGSLPPRGRNFQAPGPVFVLDQEGGTVPAQMCAF